jgi:hypothetical protein
MVVNAAEDGCDICTLLWRELSKSRRLEASL